MREHGTEYRTLILRTLLGAYSSSTVDYIKRISPFPFQSLLPSAVFSSSKVVYKTKTEYN